MTSKRRLVWAQTQQVYFFFIFVRFLHFSFKIKPVNRCDDAFRYFRLLAFCLCKLFHTRSTVQNRSGKTSQAASTRVQIFLKTDIFELGVVRKRVQQHAQVEVMTLVFPKTAGEAVYTSTDKLEFSKISSLEGVF